MNLLVTGGAGFIGSNFVHYWHNKYPEDSILIVDKFTYAASWKNLHPLLSEGDQVGAPIFYYKKGNIALAKLDLVDRNTIAWLESYHHYQNNIDIIVNFAAETHVDNSISSPEVFIDSNVKGFFNVLELTRRLKLRLYHLSTDEVLHHPLPDSYPVDLNIFPRPKENDGFPKYSPSSVYSATKAAQEMFIQAYIRTYGIWPDIIRVTNNYGPRQHREKFIPTCITKLLTGEKIPLYGKGEQIRDWTYVEDTCRGIELIIKLNDSVGDYWHIASNDERRNIDTIAKYIAPAIHPPETILPPGTMAISPAFLRETYINTFVNFVEDRPGHDFYYSLDSSKIREGLGWTPQTDFRSGIQKTIEWFKE